MKRIFLISLWSIAISTVSFSQATFQAITNGNWGTASTWSRISGTDANGIPDADDDVIINSSRKVTVNVTSTSANLTIDGAGAMLTVSSTRTLTVSGNINFLNSASVPNLTVASGATLRLAGLFTVDGANANLVPATILTADPNSVIQYNGTSPQFQIIVAADYGRLVISGTSSKTLSSAGTIRIYNNAANCFTASGTLTNTNSTIEFAGTGAQTIPAFSYYNLTSSSTGSRVLAAGTVSIANTFTPGSNSYTVAATNTVNYNSTGSQTIVPFSYQNLTATTGAKILSSTGIIKVNGVLNLVGSTGYTNSGSTVEFTGTGSFARATTLNNLIISGTLTLATNIQTTLLGNFTNNGVVTNTAGGLTFSGTTLQTLGGSSIKTTLNTLTINNIVGVAISHPVELLSTLTLSANAKLNTGDNLTLKSTATLTARLATLPAGAAVSGKLTMERYISPDPALENLASSWRTVCAPVTTTVSEWKGDFPTTGFPGADLDETNTIGFCSIQKYNETLLGTLDNGFTNIAGTSEVISPGKGFSAFIRPAIDPVINGPFTLSAKGTIASGNVDVPVSKTLSSPTTSDDGWNLVGNPYASAINWTSIANLAANRTVINATYSIYIPKQNVWGTYNPATGGTNGVTNIIPSSTAFWVVARTNGNIRFAETYKIAGGDPYKYAPSKNTNSAFILHLAGNNLSDEAIIAFNENATSSSDDGIDALKFPGGEGAPYIATVANDTDLSINALPHTIDEITLPLRVKVAKSGTYQLSKIVNPELPLTACIIIEDRLTGIKTSLTENIKYSFTINDTTKAPRFLIHINKNEGVDLNVSTTNANCENTGKVIVKTNKSQPYTIKWRDTSDKIIKTTVTSNGIDSLLNLPAGKYSVEASDGSACGFAIVNFEIQGNPVYTETYTVQSPTCYGNNDEAFIIATADTLGGLAKYTWKNSNNEIIRIVENKWQADTLSGIEPGIYKLELLYNGSCTAIEKQFTITSPQAVIADFSSSLTNVDIKNGPVQVNFTNMSTNAEDFIWVFSTDDLNDSLFTKNASHIYTKPGDYEVELTASNFLCGTADTKISTIHVYNSGSSNIDQLSENKNIHIGNDNNGAYVRFNYQENTNTTISVRDVLGRKLINDLNVKPDNQTIFIDLKSLDIQLLLITVNTGQKYITKRIIK